MIKQGFDSRSIKVINNFVDYKATIHSKEDFRSTFSLKDSKIVLYVGQMISSKGPQILLEAAHQIVRTQPNVRFVFIGQGKILNHLKTKISSDLINKILFLGHLSEEMLQQAYIESDIIVIPSLWQEPFPMVALEAMVAGKPVIASNMGGLVESVQDGETGILVEPANAKKLTEELIRLLQNSDEAEEMGKKGKIRVEQMYRPHHALEKYLAVYDKMLRQ
jgi:glycogen synthase